MQNVFDEVKDRVRSLKKHLNLTNKELKILTKPKKVSSAFLNVGGKKLKAFRIVYSDALGPGKGGIRYHSDVSKEEVSALSFWMTLKNSLLCLPFGGAKGGVRFDPTNKSKSYIEKVSRLYVDKFYKVLGGDVDIPAPDVYTNQEVMGIMLDQYEKKTKKHCPETFTGKPIELGGLKIRSDATAKGGVIILNELLHHYKNFPKKPKVAIQGFGNAGLNMAKMMFSQGYKIVAVSDRKGAIINDKGLDAAEVIEIKEETGRVGSKNCRQISNGELLKLDCDILVLAALENQITIKNAKDIKARFIVELANGPISLDADKILSKNKVVVVPDILANAGGVVASYFEWAQNKTGNILDEKLLDDKLFQMMKSAWHKVYELYKDDSTLTLRESAYIIAIKRVLAAEKFRGRL